MENIFHHMVRLTKEAIQELFVSDIDSRLNLNLRTEESESFLACLFEKCQNLDAISEEIGAGGQFSVFASLPVVSAAASSANTQITSTLVNLLNFLNEDAVYPSDLKDWSFIEDSLDSLFARIDDSLALDAHPAKKMRISSDTSSQDRTKPQLAWFDPDVNYRKAFVPVIKEKLHATEPLDPFIIRAQQDASLVREGFEFPNVYEPEIKACLKSVNESLERIESLKDVTEVEEVASAEFVYVDTIEKLDEMVDAILAAGEVAIDLEHHDIRSYRGFTSLIQLSTRTTDYVVDPFPLFHELGSKFNKFTTDPRIRKTFHGADMDIQWLQRDFGVYVVNMFDTGQAARALGLAGGFGLANLLDTFCKVKANKRFQTSDWRTRPLPKDMLQYARTDTHYLLYIRDRLENLLLGMGSGSGTLVTAYGKKLLEQVMEKSFGVSLKVWKDSPCEGADKLCLRSPAMKVGNIRRNPRALAVLGAVLGWRDETAKRLDESRNYVLSNGVCLRIANVIPTTVSQILRIVTQESSSIHPSMYIASEDADQILSLIKTALHAIEEQAKVDMEITPSTPTVESVPASRRSSVVQVGAELLGRRSDQMRDSSLLPKLTAWTIGGEPSALSNFFASAGSEISLSEQHISLQAELVRSFTECPDFLIDDLKAYKEGKHLVDEKEIEASAEAMAEAIAAVPFGTEFVPFSNKSQSSKGTAMLLDEEGLPLPLSEQRKRAPEAALVISTKKAKKQRKESTDSAALRALEFVEEELGFKKKRKNK